MMEEGVLDKALVKKNKELESLQKQNEEMKNSYEAKIRNLMGSINTLQKQNNELESQSKDNARVRQINELKKERKDQEQIIKLLRKFIARDEEVDKYLMKEFQKGGEQRLLTYEELKIAKKRLENELKKLKLGMSDQNANKKLQSLAEPKKKSSRNEAQMDETQIQLLVVKKFKEQIKEYDDQIAKLEEENTRYKASKEKMEKMQNELMTKLKDYNKDVGEMQNKYDLIKQELQSDLESKMTEVRGRNERLLKENEKLKDRIKELIKIGEASKNDLTETLIKIQRDNDIYVHLLETKKKEIDIYKNELEKIRGTFDTLDSKDVVKRKRLQSENDQISKAKVTLEATVKKLEEDIEQKKIQIQNLQNNLEVLQKTLGQELKIKDMEINLLKDKIEEYEYLLMQKEKK